MTRKAAWTSCLLLLSSPALFGQAQPAPTTWQPYQPPTVTAQPPAPPVSVPNLPALPTPVTPPKMVTYHKPADDTEPVPLPVVPPVPLPNPPQTRPIPAPQRAITARPAVFAKAQQPAPPPATTPLPAPAPQPQPTTPQTLPTAPPTADSSKMTSTTGKVPTRAELFRLDSDLALDTRILTELEKKTEKMPPIPPLVPAGTKYDPKTLNYPPTQVLLSPNFVVHRRLYFEEKNAERGGWDAGPAQCLISTAYFARDVVLWPAHFASGIHDCYDASPGKGMPGSPTPYYYYPPGITVFGGAAEMAVVTGLVFIIP